MLKSPSGRHSDGPRASFDQSGAFLVGDGLDRRQLGEDGGSDDIPPAGYHLAPCLIRWSGPNVEGWVRWPGTPNTSRPNPLSSRAAIREPRYSGPFDTTTPHAIPAVIRFGVGKFRRAGKVPIGIR
jgi:hypothetical protein